MCYPRRIGQVREDSEEEGEKEGIPRGTGPADLQGESSFSGRFAKSQRIRSLSAGRLTWGRETLALVLLAGQEALPAGHPVAPAKPVCWCAGVRQGYGDISLLGEIFLLLAGEKALEIFGPFLLVTLETPSNKNLTNLRKGSPFAFCHFSQFSL